MSPSLRPIFLTLCLLAPAVAAFGATDADFQAARQRLHEAAERADRPALRIAAREAVQLARELPNHPDTARQLNESAEIVRKQGTYTPYVRDLAVEAVNLARTGGYLDDNLELFYWAADSEKLLRHYRDQLVLAQEWLDRAEHTGQQQQYVRAAFLVVEAHWSLDRLDEGLGVVQRAVRIAQELGQHRLAGLLLQRAAATYRRVGDRPMQLQFLGEALNEARQSSDIGIVAETAGQLGYEHELDARENAATLIEEATSAAREIGKGQSAATALSHVAAYHLHRSEFDLAEKVARDAVQYAAASGMKSTHFAASSTLARVLTEKGDRPAAIEAARASMDRLTPDLLANPALMNFDERQGLAALTQVLAGLHEQQGSLEEALGLQQLGARVKAIDTEARHKMLVAQANFRIESAMREEKIRDLEQGQKFQELELEKERLALINERNRTKALEKIEQARNLELASSKRMNAAYAIIALLAIGLLGVNLYAVFAQRRNARLLRQHNEQLRLLNAEKDEFLAIAAHDLKSPLGGIERACEIIADPQTDSSFARELARDMSQSAARMFHLVTRLLDLRRIGQPNEPLAPCNVTELARSIHAEALPKASAKRITLELAMPETPVRALGDPVRITQILDNLLSNALKFSPSGRRVTVAVAHDATGPLLAVADEGPGITADEQQRMFQKFAQLSARPTAGEHSTGLGLAIVHAQVAALGGSIACESEPGRGARFVVRLQPVAAPRHPVAISAAA